ncbi:MAG TPA: hypothetical protein VGA45_17625 [Actinomycetota bacterium]
MLRILGVNGSPGIRLAVAGGLIALAVWHHSVLPGVIGAGLLLVTVAGAFGPRPDRRRRGQREDGWL